MTGHGSAAGTLDASKSHRLVRLVGVLRDHGRPSDFWKAAPLPRYAFRVVVLDRPRERLYRRIDERVDAMLEGGLIEETRRLGEAGHSALRTIGYAEAAAFLRNEITHEDMRRLIQRNTRRFAKRQLTWLRRRTEAIWLDAATASVDSVLDSTNTATG